MSVPVRDHILRICLGVLMISIGVTAIGIPTMTQSLLLISGARIQWGDGLPSTGLREPLTIRLELMYADGRPIEASSPVARYTGAGGPVLGINATAAIPIAMGTQLLWGGRVYDSAGSPAKGVDLGLFYFFAKDGCDETQGRSCFTSSFIVATTRTDSNGGFGVTGNRHLVNQLFAWNLPRGVAGEVAIVYADLASATFQQRVKTHYAVELKEPSPILGVWINGQQIVDFSRNMRYVSESSGVVTFRFGLQAGQSAYLAVGRCGGQGCLDEPPQSSLIIQELTPTVTERSLTVALDPSYYMFYVLTSPRDPFRSALRPGSVLVLGIFDTLNVTMPSEYQLLGLVPLAVGTVLVLAVLYEMASRRLYKRRIRAKICHVVKQSPLRSLIVVAIFSRVFVFAVAVFTTSVFGERTCDFCSDIAFPFLNLFSRWDAGHYAAIALVGYGNLIVPRWAFFPAYPVLIGTLGRLLTVTTQVPLDLAVYLAGFLVSNLAFFGSVYYLYMLSMNVLRNAKLAYYSALFLAIYPAGVFLSAVYSESLFLLLTLSSLYYWRMLRLDKSAVLGFLAALTRPVGILLALPYLYEILADSSRRRLASSYLPVVSVLLGYLAFMTYSQVMTGTPLAAFAAERLYWGVVPNRVLMSYNDILASPIIVPYLVLSICGVAASLSTARSKAETAIDLFAIGLLMTYLLTPLTSFPRFSLTLVPAYWSYSRWSQYAGAKTLMYAVFLILLAIGTGLFVNWYNFY